MIYCLSFFCDTLLVYGSRFCSKHRIYRFWKHWNPGLILPVARIAFVVSLSLRLIATVVVTGRLRSGLLLSWLRSECSNVLLLDFRILLWIIFYHMDSVESWLCYICFHPVLHEECLIGIIHSEACQVLWDNNLRTFSGAAALKIWARRNLLFALT